MVSMIDIMVPMAISIGDAEEYSHGKVSMSYIKRLDSIYETEDDIQEKEFEMIWTEIADELGIERDGGLLNIDKETGEVCEILAINPEFKEALEQIAEQEVRMKEEVIK